MKSIRRHLSYANVVSTIALFLVLGGATAFAAKELARNSVETKQLKSSAVTGPKIKDGAVNGSKLADGAVTTPKLADGSVTADKLAPGALPPPTPIPGLPIVRHRLLNTTSLEFPPTTKEPDEIPLPLEHATFTQAAGEVDLIVASIDAHIPASCVSFRTAEARLRMDAGNGRSRDEIIGVAHIEDKNAGEGSVRLHFAAGEFGHGIVISAPSAPTQHTFSVELLRSSCNGAAVIPSHIIATGVQIEVIGFR